MKRSFRSALALSVILIPCFTGFAGSLPDKVLTPTLTVRLYDYVGIAPEETAEMRTEASRILVKAGIRSTWLNCRVPSAERAEHPACRTPRTATGIVLRIVSGDQATRKRFGFTGLGFSVVADKGGFLATVILSRVEQLAKEGVASRGQILGCAAVHEIGHLLLSSTSHSLAGIMRAHWGRGDLRKMAAGSLLFNSREAGLTRENVVRRSRR